jgi:excisionase family DNA binding protein
MTTPIDVMEPGSNSLRLCEKGALAVPEAADFLRLSRAQVYRLMESGELIYTIQGRRRRVPKRALIELLARGLRGGGAR